MYLALNVTSDIRGALSFFSQCFEDCWTRWKYNSPSVSTMLKSCFTFHLQAYQKVNLQVIMLFLNNKCRCQSWLKDVCLFYNRCNISPVKETIVVSIRWWWPTVGVRYLLPATTLTKRSSSLLLLLEFTVLWNMANCGLMSIVFCMSVVHIREISGDVYGA